MGNGDSKLSQKTLVQEEEQYALQMRKLAVNAAMDVLEIDKPTTGLRFYRLFARMDADGSKTIDLEEFHRYFELPHTTFSDLVFSNLGKQTPIRGVAFDDFVLNLWNFCTMSSRDIYTHIFRLYDDDHNGTLDAQECESLFRLLYHTDDLPRVVKLQLIAMTSGDTGVISLDTFLKMCTSKKSLFKPIFHLQTRARIKSLGASYWSSASKKRSQILNGHKDIFDVASSRLQIIRQQEAGLVSKSTADPPDSPSRRLQSLEVTSPMKRPPPESTTKQEKTDTKSLDSWVQVESQKQPLVQAYLGAFTQAYVAERRLSEYTQKAPGSAGQDQLLLDLRYNVVVSSKKRDGAHVALEKVWEEEQSSLIAKRHQIVAAMVKSTSTRTLHQQTNKKTAAKVVKSYTQKKLNLEETEIRQRFTERWATLHSAAEQIAQREFEASRRTAWSGSLQPRSSLHVKATHPPNESNKSKVLPITPR